MTSIAGTLTETDVPEGCGVLAILDHTGDTKVIWDSTKGPEVEAARTQFDMLVKKGYQAFKVDRQGEKGELIRHFDPNAEKIILSPAMVGG